MKSPLVVTMTTLAILLVRPLGAQSESLPPGFLLTPVGSSWETPVAIAFIDSTRLLVAEKRGTVWYVENDKKVNIALDLRNETLDNGDRGLLGIAVDPDFIMNGRIYVLMVVDPDPTNADASREAFTRLVRYRLVEESGDLVAEPGSRTPLFGDPWSTGAPVCFWSHACGSLHFLSDGSLIVATGDGARFDVVDSGGLDPGCFGEGRISEEQDMGAFRALSMNSLAGKLLRIDPENGLGLSDNPYFNGDPSQNTSRFWATGLRNPFRVAPLRGTGPREVLAVADVGWSLWEEITLCHGGECLGWPCSEGLEARDDYRAADTRNLCASLESTFKGPLIAWHHTQAGKIGFVGRAATGLAWTANANYPPLWRDALFFCDFRDDWIRFARLDSNLALDAIHLFTAGVGRPVDLVLDPFNGELLLVTYEEPGRVKRLRFIGDDLPPHARAIASPTFGKAPLSVTFDATTSADPEGSSLTYSWDLGDGTMSSEPLFEKTYSQDGHFDVTLTVRDETLNTSFDTVVVTPGNTPPSIDAVLTPQDGDLFSSEDKVILHAEVSDAEDPSPLVVWHVDRLWPSCEQRDWWIGEGAVSQFVVTFPQPGTSYRIRCEVIDAAGLAVESTMEIFDRDAHPLPFFVDTSDLTPRIGQTISPVGHVVFPGDHGEPPVDLVWDWGDGTSDTFPSVGDREDTRPVHIYMDEGDRILRLVARRGESAFEVSLPVKVGPAIAEFALFAPLVVEQAMSWIAQEREVCKLATSLGDPSLVHVFTWSEQDDLARFANTFLDDGVADVIVIFDTCPSVLYAGEDNGSLAEEWLEKGNVLIYSGATPFKSYIGSDGRTSTSGAGPFGADEVLDARLPLIAFGAGDMEITQLARRTTPALRPFTTQAAIRLHNLGSTWQKDEAYAMDFADLESDALCLRHTQGGLYVQFLCVSDDTAPRADVIGQWYARYRRGPESESEPFSRR